MTSRRPTQNDRRRSAEAPVEALEALSLGEPFAAAGREAQTAVEALARDAAAALFRIVAVGADLAADLAFYTGFHRETFTAEALVLHQAALESHPELAQAMRTPAFIARVGQAAAGRALNRPAEELAAGEVRTYQRQVAAQLHARQLDEPHSEVLGAVVPELEARIQKARERHEAHAAAELARQEAEQREADRVLAEERRARLLELEEQARRDERSATAAAWEARRLRAQEIAQRIRRSKLEGLRVDGALYDHDNLLRNLSDMSEPQLKRIADALDAVNA